MQLLDDLIGWRSKHKMELWLASFDVEKCYDTLPCWALFGMMRQCGMPLQVVQCFEDFHRRLRRRFRYGQVDGELWQACNGAPQGDPASPDLLNLLLEPFHRWARAEGLGVGVAGSCIPSVSFADDLVLVGGSRKELETVAYGCATPGIVWLRSTQCPANAVAGIGGGRAGYVGCKAPPELEFLACP